MPFLAPIVAGISALLAVPIVGAFIKAVALGLVARFAFKYKKKNTNEAQDRMIMVRSAVEPHRMVVGLVLVSGTVAYMELTGSNKEYLHIVVLLAGHEIEAIEEVYFDDVLVGTLDGS